MSVQTEASLVVYKAFCTFQALAGERIPKNQKEKAGFISKYEGRKNGGIPCFAEERSVERAAKVWKIIEIVPYITSRCCDIQMVAELAICRPSFILENAFEMYGNKVIIFLKLSPESSM